MQSVRNPFIISLLLLFPASGWCQAHVNEKLETAFIYVNGTTGSDSNPGTEAQPLKTIGKAVSMAETNNQEDIGSRVIIDPGTYREVVTISPAPGATTMPMTFEAATNGTVFVSGAEQYSDWTPYSENPSIYTTPWTYNWGLCTPITGAYLPIPDVVMRREMVFINGTPLTQVTEFSALTAPGTFYVDETGGMMYIWPPTGTNIGSADVEVSTQPLIWDMRGQSNVVVRGLTFEYGNPCRENAEVLVNSPSPVANVLFDTDNFEWSNAEGLNFGPTTSYVTVENSTANHNGESGFQNIQVLYALFQSDTASFNNWRGAQGAYYNFNSGGLHFSLMHDLTLEALNSTYNQTFGIHFDTDDASVTASNELMAQNLLDGTFVERNEGPLTFSNSTFCGGNPTTYPSNISFSLRDSDGVTVSTSNLVDSSQGLNVTGEPGGESWYNWQTGQPYTADNSDFTFTGNVVEPLAGQYVCRVSELDTSDWDVFQGTLTSNNNTWWSSGNTLAYIVPVNNAAIDFATWQSDTGQDANSTWADPSGNPEAACAVTADMNDFWFVVPYTQTYFTVSPGASAVWTANLVPLLNFASNVKLSADGIEYIAGATGSWSATTVGPTGAPTFTVTTSPTTPPATYPITLIANSGSLTHTIEVLLIVDNTVVLSSQSVNFGNQLVKTSSTAQPVTLTNNGTTALSISSISLGPPNGKEFSESDNCGGSVPPNSSCTLNFTFTPTASGAASSTVTVTDSAPSSPQQIALSGTGTAPAASLSPSALTFSGQAVGTTSPAQTVTLSNTGSASLTITSIVLSGGGASSFAQSNNCGSSLAAGSSCSINVTFDPTRSGVLLGQLTVTDSATPATQKTSLTGTGDQAAATLSPTSLTFPSTAVGSKSASQTITLTNTGTATLDITSIALGGTDPGDFTEKSHCGATLAVNASCAITVTFDPTKSGHRVATITVTDNALGSTQTALVTGTGTN